MNNVMPAETPQLMPVLFVGHGSPMNAIEENSFSKTWQEIGKTLPRPEAILCISAHWETRGTFVTSVQKPETIHDFYGFPEQLYEVQYPAPGSPRLAKDIREQSRTLKIGADTSRGLDHGCWSVLKHFLPLLYVLAQAETHDNPSFFNDSCVYGSISMTSLKINLT
jgi:4,5-DOPA dioxygenase extradiol